MKRLFAEVRFINDRKGLVRQMSGGMAGLIASLRSGDPLKIMPYGSYGNSDRLFLSGRVLEDEGILPAEDADTVPLRRQAAPGFYCGARGRL